MNLKTEAITLDGIVFETTQFPAMRAYGLMAKLLKQLGPAMAILAEVDGETQMSALAPVLGGAMSNVEPVEAQKLLVEILAGTTAQTNDALGGRVVSLGDVKAIDDVFSGRLVVLFQVAAHALKVNYSDFFGVSARAAATPQAGS